MRFTVGSRVCVTMLRNLGMGLVEEEADDGVEPAIRSTIKQTEWQAECRVVESGCIMRKMKL